MNRNIVVEELSRGGKVYIKTTPTGVVRSYFDAEEKLQRKETVVRHEEAGKVQREETHVLFYIYKPKKRLDRKEVVTYLTDKNGTFRLARTCGQFFGPRKKLLRQEEYTPTYDSRGNPESEQVITSTPDSHVPNGLLRTTFCRFFDPESQTVLRHETVIPFFDAEGKLEREETVTQFFVSNGELGKKETLNKFFNGEGKLKLNVKLTQWSSSTVTEEETFYVKDGAGDPRPSYSTSITRDKDGVNGFKKIYFDESGKEGRPSQDGASSISIAKERVSDGTVKYKIQQAWSQEGKPAHHDENHPTRIFIQSNVSPVDDLSKVEAVIAAIDTATLKREEIFRTPGGYKDECGQKVWDPNSSRYRDFSIGAGKQTFNPDGSREEVYFRDDEVYITKSFHPNGKPASETHYKYLNPNNKDLFYDDDNPSTTRWNDRGDIIFQEWKRRDRLDRDPVKGSAYVYNEYDDLGRLVCRNERWFIKGKVREVEAGGPAMRITHYNPSNGLPISTEDCFWKDGQEVPAPAAPASVGGFSVPGQTGVPRTPRSGGHEF